MNKNKYRLLVLEDNPRDLYIVREMLSASTTTIFDIAAATTCADALRQVLQYRFDAILTDLNVPDSKGLDTLRSIHQYAQGIPIVVLTAEQDEQTAIDAVRQGAQDYLVKTSLSTELVVRALRYAVERQRAGEEIRKTGDRLQRMQMLHQAVLRGTPNGLCILSPYWNITFANAALKKLFLPNSASTDVLSGESFSIFFPDTVAFEGYRTNALKSLRAHDESREEMRLRTHDGRAVWCEVTLTRMDPTETACGYVATVVDISSRKQAEHEREVLSDLTAKLSGSIAPQNVAEIVAGATDSIWHWDGFALEMQRSDPELYVTVLSVNRTGRQTEKLEALEHSTPRAVRDGQDRINHAGTVSGKESDSLLNCFGASPEGTKLMYAPVRSAGGVVGFFALRFCRPTDLDASDLNLLQRIADAAGPALERCRAEADRRRLVAAVEQSSEAIVITDTHWCINYVNSAYERITGYTREESIGERPRVLFSSGNYAPLFCETISQQLLDGQTWSGILTNRRKNGEEYQENVTITPIRDESGQTVNFAMVRRDITREAALESELRQSQKIEAIGGLAGGIAHDFNNLLQIVIGQGELMLMRMNESDALRDDIQRIVNAGRRGASLTRQLLAFSRKQTLQPQVLDLNDAVASIQRMLDRVIGEDIEFVCESADEQVLINADPGQVEQILLNLAVNARDAMPNGGRITVKTSIVELDESFAAEHLEVIPGSYILLQVEDTGSGMNEATLSHIFEPFFTTKEAGKGTGLGLSTVYGIVKQSDGHIFVESKAGSGTAFKIYLPKCDKGIAAESPISIKAAAGNETILLVEDESEVRMLMRMLLEHQGYRILEACNGAEALLIAEGHEGEIDLLLTDVVMPEVSGYEVAEKMSDLHPEARVMFVSGYTERVARQNKGKERGILLSKPVGPEVLIKKVREVLDSKVAVA